jgi:hypothetical protein
MPLLNLTLAWLLLTLLFDWLNFRTIIGISFLKFLPYPYSLEGILVSLNSLIIV